MAHIVQVVVDAVSGHMGKMGGAETCTKARESKE